MQAMIMRSSNWYDTWLWLALCALLALALTVAIAVAGDSRSWVDRAPMQGSPSASVVTTDIAVGPTGP